MHVLISCALMALAAAQQTIKDPVASFCRRHLHQTCVIDSKLYIDGGQVYYGSSVTNDSHAQANTFLLYEDFSELQTTNADFPSQHSNLTKGDNVPTVSGGVLWPDQVNKLFYLFGGRYFNTSMPQFTCLWFYDIIYNSWNCTTTQKGQDQISWPAVGASAVSDEGVAYYYGGVLDEFTIPNWHANPQMLSSLLSFDMNTQKWTNLSDATPRAEGTLHYIPVSDRGMLVYIGGVETDSHGDINYANMSQIHLFDIASSQWYTQTATGDIPQARSGFCAGIVTAPDYSSYNIYVFGGMDKNQNALGDLYILSLPSFEWISWYPNPQKTVFAGGKAYSSCNIINFSQMVIMGGQETNASDVECDAPQTGGQHGLLLGQESIEQGNLWHRLMFNVTGYAVPQNITNVIGGNTEGKATVTQPAHGWATSDLAIYFKSTYSAYARTATRPIPSGAGGPTGSPERKSVENKGAIVGGVVGGVIGLVAMITIACFCLRTRRKKRVGKTQPDQISKPGDHKFAVLNFDSPRSTGQSVPFTPHDSPAQQWSPAELSSSQHMPIPPDRTYSQMSYPSPPEPSEYRESAYTELSELPGEYTPSELPDVRTTVPVRKSPLIG